MVNDKRLIINKCAIAITRVVVTAGSRVPDGLCNGFVETSHDLSDRSQFRRRY